MYEDFVERLLEEAKAWGSFWEEEINKARQRLQNSITNKPKQNPTDKEVICTRN